MKIISIANQKGGVGKTTTALNLASALKLKGKSVLLIDLDPQGNLSNYLGYTDDDKPTIGELMYKVVEGKPVTIIGAVRTSESNGGLQYIPANINLANAEFYLSSAISRETVLRRVLWNMGEYYDYVIIDCLPSLGILLLNALAASDELLIPVQTQTFALAGLDQLMNIYNIVKSGINPPLCLLGILPTMADKTNMTAAVQRGLCEDFGNFVFKTTISKSIEAAYSVEKKKSLCLTGGKLGIEYMAVADEVIERSQNEV
jgi:chromosome partitioning protein